MLRYLLGGLAACFLLVACGGQESSTEPASAAKVTTPEPPAAKPAVQQPATPAPPATPPATGGGDAAAGAKAYAIYCVSCHGVGGKGDGPVGKTLNPPPADHTDTKYIGSLTDEHLYKVINKGGVAVGKSPLMAPWGAIVGEKGVRDLIAHVRKLSKS